MRDVLPGFLCFCWYRSVYWWHLVAKPEKCLGTGTSMKPGSYQENTIIWRAYPSSHSDCKKRHNSVKICRHFFGKGAAQTVPACRGHQALLLPALLQSLRVQGCRQETSPKTSAQQEAGEWGKVLRLALDKVNWQIQLIQCVREKKDPGFTRYPG